MLADFLKLYQDILHFVAEITVHSLELVGIAVIVIGSFKAISKTLHRLKNKQNTNIIIDLGRSLALALEFKMGAEIVNTVIIRDLKELGILAIVIALRAILALLIHWEIKNERKEEADHKSNKEKQ